MWDMVDTEHSGVLSQDAFYRLCKLVALAQQGKTTSIGNLSSPTSLPVFESLDLGNSDDPSRRVPPSPSMTAASSRKPSVAIVSDSRKASTTSTLERNTSGFLSSSTSGGVPPASYKLSPEERERYRAAFISCSPVNGMVPGDKARDLFVKSGLPIEVLSKIWYVLPFCC